MANATTYTITVPSSAEEGDILTFAVNGTTLEMAVPVGSKPGDVLEVQVGAEEGGHDSDGDGDDEDEEEENDSNSHLYQDQPSIGSISEAQQLDSVTDRVQENETVLDSSKAKTAIAALNSSSSAGKLDQTKLANIKVTKEDVDWIVHELEVTEDVADRTLREVIFDNDGAVVEEGKGPLGEALRRLLVA